MTRVDGFHRLAPVKGQARLSGFSWPLTAVLAAALALMGLPGAAQAACDPAAASNVTATCTGTTTNQNIPNGYGIGFESNLTTTVVPGASVTGTNDGIHFHTGTVSNSGTISGGTISIFVDDAATVSNSGIITGGTAGIFINSTATVTNSGTISGGAAPASSPAATPP